MYLPMLQHGTSPEPENVFLPGHLPLTIESEVGFSRFTILKNHTETLFVPCSTATLEMFVDCRHNQKQ